MAALDHIQNMYDVAFKIRLLRKLVREHLPDEKHPFNGPLELSYVVSMVKMHQLLTESDTTNSSNPKLLDSWKAAVDAWVNRVLALASGNMPDKCWAGISLLGLTCQECNSERFVASYSEWLQKLPLHIQPPADSHFVKVASYALLADVFSRLGRIPRVKKDANSQAAKFVPQVLKLLNEDSSEVVWKGAVCLLCTLITYFPSSIQRSYDNVEAAVVSKIMSGKCSNEILKELSHCLALLPKSRGDEESWSLMMHKILYVVNIHLKDVFQGVEEESRSDESLRLLVPPGKDPPPPLGGCRIGDASDHKTKKPERLHISSVSALMHCCYMMLTNTYPVRVRVPIRSLVALVGRVLMVDGSSSQALFPFMTSMQQELICSELPILHLYSLKLFRAVIKSLRSQLLPYAAEIVKLLTEYFKGCLLPDLRIEVYAITRILLMSMGVGVAVYLAHEVIANAVMDLDGHVGVRPSSNAYSKVSNEPLWPCQKKRKHGKTTGSLVEQTDKADQEVGPSKSLTPLAVKIAALETLEAVLTVGGALGANSWRSTVDRLLIAVATNSCKGGWAKEENHGNTLKWPAPTMADFQIAALKSLLASLLSPARYRPPYLAQGLVLFRRGMRETGTKLAEFCAHALLALEVLIHPRALPLVDYSSPSTGFSNVVDNRFPDVYSFGVKHNHTSFSSSSLGKGLDNPNPVGDELLESWLAEDENMEIQATIVGKDDKIPIAKDPENIRVPSPEKVLVVPDSSSSRTLEESRDELASVGYCQNTEGKGDENMVKAQPILEPINGSTPPITRVVLGDMGPDHLIAGVTLLLMRKFI